MKQRVPLGLFWVGVSLGVAALAAAQQNKNAPVTQDPQAVALLNQALSAAGGVPALAAVTDFMATGTITDYWGGQQVAGAATVRGRGSDQFRLDATIPDGTRSYAVSHGVGGLKDTRGLSHRGAETQRLKRNAFLCASVSQW